MIRDALKAVLVLLALAAPAAAEPPAALEAGVARSIGPLRAGESAVLPLPAAAGDYVRGTLVPESGRFDLDLRAADGRHLRRLASDAEGRVLFQFVADGTPLALALTARADGRAELAVDARIAAAAQESPPTTRLSPAMERLAQHVAAGGDTAAFWTDMARAGTPLVEPGPDGQAIVTFLARGAHRNVRLFGAPSGDHEWMERIGASDTWFRSFLVPQDTRLSYQIAPDVPDLPGSARDRRLAILATAQADPYNLKPWPADAPDAFNRESVLELPAAPPQPGLDGAPAAGRLPEFRIAASRLGNSRTVTLYTPPGFDPADPRNVLLVVFDARAYLTKVPTPAILDRLIADGRLPPVVAAFVSEIDPATRARELPANPDFADFLADELLPQLAALTGARIPANRTILAGSSFGGLAAVTAALRRPERFSNAIALSGSFWWHPEGTPPEAAEYVAGQVASRAPADVRVHITAGQFETAHAGAAGILETSRHLRDVMTAKGYDVSYREYAGGHDYLVWRGALPDALLALVPRLPPAR